RRLDGGAVAEESRADLLRERVNIQVGDRVLGSVSVGFSIIEINEAMQEQIVWNIVMALLFILLFSSLSAWISRRLSRPLERLNHAMNAIRTGNLEQQVEAETHDEIAQLTRSFNEMIAGLRERQIIENLGYELSATFQSDRLAPLVRERLKSAIGAAGARLYIKRSGGTLFYEITTGDAQQIEFPPLEVDR
ncbi:MAG: HAMP domain-containing protein, partial [Calditrichaeota bacterium]|nr:HAMP domain-containing protein [Calditrichota bacterium]